MEREKEIKSRTRSSLSPILFNLCTDCVKREMKRKFKTEIIFYGVKINMLMSADNVLLAERVKIHKKIFP